MTYSRKQLEYFGEPFGECATRLKPGGRIYGGGSSPSTPEKQTIEQTSIPEYAKPYVEKMLGKTEALTNAPYQAYQGERIAGFTPMQQQAQQSAANLGPAKQLGTATQMAGLAGLNALNTRYDPTSFRNQYQAPGQYAAGSFGGFGVDAPYLQQFQMGPAERVRTQSFVMPGAANAYMSPYQQAVTDVEKREATRSSDIMQQQQQAQAVQQGAFGGSRSAIVEAERQRNLGQQLGDIQARGSQSAFQQAQQQFNAEQQARLQAQMANQQAGLTTGGQNLGALLGVQQLGAGQNLQAQLANQQYGLEAQRLGEQSRQYGYGQGMTSAQLAAQYGTEAQRLGEQSRQFGSTLGLQGAQAAGQLAGTLGQLGQTQFGQQQAAIQGQASMGAQQQALEQQRLSQQYQDFIAQRQYPYTQLAFQSDMLRGLPLSQTASTMYEAPPSMLSQVGGLGLAAYGMFGNPYGQSQGQGQGRKEGGHIKESSAPAGLSELLLYGMENA